MISEEEREHRRGLARELQAKRRLEVKAKRVKLSQLTDAERERKAQVKRETGWRRRVASRQQRAILAAQKVIQEILATADPSEIRDEVFG